MNFRSTGAKRLAHTQFTLSHIHSLQPPSYLLGGRLIPKGVLLVPGGRANHCDSPWPLFGVEQVAPAGGTGTAHTSVMARPVSSPPSNANARLTSLIGMSPLSGRDFTPLSGSMGIGAHAIATKKRERERERERTRVVVPERSGGFAVLRRLTVTAAFVTLGYHIRAVKLSGPLKEAFPPRPSAGMLKLKYVISICLTSNRARLVITYPPLFLVDPAMSGVGCVQGGYHQARRGGLHPQEAVWGIGSV
ncbi:unnamed protein product, partial [Discosporangium mesarthrocarpum]